MCVQKNKNNRRLIVNQLKLAGSLGLAGELRSSKMWGHVWNNVEKN